MAIIPSRRQLKNTLLIEQWVIQKWLSIFNTNGINKYKKARAGLFYSTITMLIH